MRSKPNFFIVGGPKCGTTALASYLKEHPQVFMSEPKEPHFFNTDINNSAIRNREHYLSLFDRVQPGHKVIGEASVWYLYSKVAVTHIEQEVVGAKYIVMLRNPTDMAYSLHEQMNFSNYENIRDFERAWQMQHRRRQGKDVPAFCPDPKLLLYQEACCLGSQLERLLSVVDRQRVLILFQQDMNERPKYLWREVQEFLRIDDDGRSSFPVVNAAKARRSRLLKSANDAYVALRMRYGLKPLGTGVFERLNHWNIRERQRPPMRIEFRQQLAHKFLPEVQKLERLTGRDLSGWYPDG